MYFYLEFLKFDNCKSFDFNKHNFILTETFVILQINDLK